MLRAALYCFSEQFPHLFPVVPKIYNPEREDNARKRWLTPEELAALLNATKSPHIRLFILLGITTGARPDAILDLKWDAIDFNAKRIHLNPNGRAQTSKHRPVMPLQDVLWTELQQAWENEMELAQVWRSRSKGRPTSGYVVSYGGYPLGSIKKAFARAVEAAGLDRDVVPYTLRHTAASWLAQGAFRWWKSQPFSAIAIRGWLSGTMSTFTPTTRAGPPTKSPKNEYGRHNTPVAPQKEGWGERDAC